MFFHYVRDFGELRGRSERLLARLSDSRSNVLHFASALNRIEEVDELAYALDNQEYAGNRRENDGGSLASEAQRDCAEHNQRHTRERHAPPPRQSERAVIKRANHADKARDHSPHAEQHGENIGDKAVHDHAEHAQQYRDDAVEEYPARAEHHHASARKRRDSAYARSNQRRAENERQPAHRVVGEHEAQHSADYQHQPRQALEYH